MAIYLLRILVDCLWYTAFMLPIFRSAAIGVKIVAAAIPAAWCIWLLYDWKRQDHVSEAVSVFLFQCRFRIVAEAFEWLFMGMASWQEQCVPFILMFVLAGFLLLRVGRLTQMSRGHVRFWGVSGVQLGLIFLAAAVCTSQAVRVAVRRVVSAVYFGLILPLMEAIVWVIAWIIGILVEWLAALLNRNTEPVEPPEFIMEGIRGGEEYMTNEAYAGSPILQAILYLCVACVIICLLYYLYQRLSDSARFGGGKIVGTLIRSASEDGTKRQKRENLLDLRRNVRYYYRQFLRLCLERGLDTKSPVTSDSAYRMASGRWSDEEAKELRDLYRSVRYGNEPETSEQRRRAASLYRKWKEVE